MPGNHARDGFVALVAIADPHINVVFYPQALATACVINGDLHRSYRNKLVRFPRPREMTLGIATELAAEDPLKRSTLLLGSPRV